MKITVIGSGCHTCEALYNKVRKLKEEGKIKAEIEYVKDIKELVTRGIMGSPALIVDGKVVCVGMPENDSELLEIIKKNSR